MKNLVTLVLAAVVPFSSALACGAHADADDSAPATVSKKESDAAIARMDRVRALPAKKGHAEAAPSESGRLQLIDGGTVSASDGEPVTASE